MNAPKLSSWQQPKQRVHGQSLGTLSTNSSRSSRIPKFSRRRHPLGAAIEQIHIWFESPTLQVIGESTMSYWPTLADLLSEAKVTGAKIHDARVAAIALHHACTTLYSADRDFNRFPGVPVKNPLVGT
jgi:predicted nucleic acid-binding protein